MAATAEAVFGFPAFPDALPVPGFWAAFLFPVPDTAAPCAETFASGFFPVPVSCAGAARPVPNRRARNPVPASGAPGLVAGTAAPCPAVPSQGRLSRFPTRNAFGSTPGFIRARSGQRFEVPRCRAAMEPYVSPGWMVWVQATVGVNRRLPSRSPASVVSAGEETFRAPEVPGI